ncbi:MAG TPA: PorP/SprF family type IX secretion system membrane protein [Flavobacteriales bacterium]|nr:PorP/SprF family type IX secretion system membrane protein [Flavobacteriales bacterium]HNU55710.1 PorP/SprF family type IX secretion system membrane protein [Flavobacteriales bacterium]
MRTVRHRLLLGAMLAFGLALTGASLSAQDIHFSQFFNTPLASGPGLIGAFDGDYRFNGIFRQQWRAVTIPYRTFAFGGDAADAAGVKGLGLGAWLFDDKAGDSRLDQTHLSLGASWTRRFGPGDEHAFTGGVQFGSTALSLDPSGLTFDNQYNGYYYDPDLGSGEQFARSSSAHLDVHAGFTYRYLMDERTRLQFGFGIFNLTTPEIRFLNGPSTSLDRRASGHVILNFPVAERLDLSPMLQFMTQGEFQEFDIGSNLRYIMLDRYGIRRAVLVGAHYRAADAGYLYAGLEHDDWTFGVSYDINTSDLVPASRNRGAIELTAIRILRKRPAIPVHFKACPAQI